MPHPRLVLANAAAGSADDEAVTAALAVLREGGEVEVVTPDDPAELRRALAGAEGRDVVIMGGDGSIHACLDTLARLGTTADVGPFAVVPLGTGNDLARGLGLPLDAEAAARVALTGRTRSLDLLVDDDGAVVVNAVHAGVGAEAAAKAEGLKKVLGPAAYPLGALRAGTGVTGWRLRITVDGTVLHEGDVLMVTVGLGSSIGGGTEVAPDAEPDDGLADVVVATATGPLARAGYARDLRHGEHLGREDVVLARGTEVRVEAVGPEDAFRTNADGEVTGPHTSRTWRVVPGAWRCRVPG
ncbi:YegS/Rv2252/BmrU family lipid kinase [Georgenia sp. M64]|jgi:YegS/Rv2252/BmrU family lipid kinase|uniref:diacylglycerol/lipid kinase family protein n=1 Tax=Georgenia sp. M64 TaxID=3120520 RepID=UPI0030E1CEFB